MRSSGDKSVNGVFILFGILDDVVAVVTMLEKLCSRALLLPPLMMMLRTVG